MNSLESRVNSIFAAQTAAAVQYWQNQLARPDQQVLQKLDAEKSNLFHVIRYGLEEPAVQQDALVAALDACDLVEGRDYWLDWLPHFEFAYREMGLSEKRLEIRLLNRLGQIHRMRYLPQQALSFHLDALTLAREIQQDQLIAITHYNLGEAYIALRRYPEAKAHARQALDFFTKIPNQKKRLAVILNTLGEAARYQRELAESKQYLSQAIELAHENQQTLYEARFRSNLALAYQAAEEIPQAEQQLSIAWSILANSGYEFDKTTVQLNQGFLQAVQGNWPEAVRLFSNINREYLANQGYEGRLAHVLTNLGYALFKAGQLDRAEQALEEAIQVWPRVGQEVQLGNALASLAEVNLATSNAHRASSLLQQALDYFARHPDDKWANDLAAKYGNKYSELQRELAGHIL
ncbi:MAG: tetratricopeptide repeat protein [Ardenticatenaceae bacterium]|nr:tetratricopeptide repeat protein [Ardenticatenaceae bacterium]